MQMNPSWGETHLGRTSSLAVDTAFDVLIKWVRIMSTYDNAFIETLDAVE
jgi:hypothetical protein